MQEKSDAPAFTTGEPANAIVDRFHEADRRMGRATKSDIRPIWRETHRDAVGTMGFARAQPILRPPLEAGQRRGVDRRARTTCGLQPATPAHAGRSLSSNQF